ncbi:MAG TPA: citrate/2-methylcitrate synthase [Myxococcota bacterium]|nr:citrate/2-methylcitrate synthase [Myxococcota bacterium]
MAEEVPEYVGAIDRGLESVVACTTSISAIVGSTLTYRGYTIEDLAAHSTFEEVVYLLWNGRLPTQKEYSDFQASLHEKMALPQRCFGWFHGLPTEVHPMDFLHAVVAGLSLHDPDANVIADEPNRRKAIRLTARLGTIIAAYHRVRTGQWPLQPIKGESLSWNFLYMLCGEEPDPKRVKQFDTCLILHADHELNASAFSARVTSSTESGLYSSIMAAIGTLKGPLHGGANERVMRMLQEIGSMDHIEPFLKEALAEKRKVMGFGHRVYKEGDPRAKILREMSRQITAEIGQPQLYEMSARIDDVMQREKGLLPNVDFYSATVYHAMGIPTDLFTPVFAMSRVAGWCAHVLEQYAKNRIYRPRGKYVGPTGLRYVPIAQRAS